MDTTAEVLKHGHNPYRLMNEKSQRRDVQIASKSSIQCLFETLITKSFICATDLHKLDAPRLHGSLFPYVFNFQVFQATFARAVARSSASVAFRTDHQRHLEPGVPTINLRPGRDLLRPSPTQANLFFYLGQSYLGQVPLRPISFLLRPVLLRPGLLRPALV